MKYDEVAATFRERGCILLSTQEEMEKAGRIPKVRYTAKCGHDHIVFYNVFKNRGTGVLCPNCVIQENSRKLKDKMQNDKLQCIRLEKTCIDYFIESVSDTFECIKAFDGCRSDIIFRPLAIADNCWVGIQVKSTAFNKADYGFSLTNKNYQHLLILCMCWEDKRMWMFPYEVVQHATKISIGLKVSKYNSYELTNENLKTKLSEYYNLSAKQTFENLDTPKNIYQQREKLFRKIREVKIDFLQFTYTNIEGEVFDFICEGLKVQEKVGAINKKGYCFCLYKCNGVSSKKRHFISYNKGDNDMYWLNCPDNMHFFVIPEAELIERKKVNTAKKEYLLLSSKNDTAWYSKFKFNYNNIDKDELLKIFQKR